MADRYQVDLFTESAGDVTVWVAQFAPGGPDVCAQAHEPAKALLRLSHTLMRECHHDMSGSIDAIPKRPVEED